MSEDYFGGAMGTIWVQPDGPNTAPQYLGCHDLGDISEPGGDITKHYHPDRAGGRRRKVAYTSVGVPADVTTSITAMTGPKRDYLQELASRSARCPFPIYVHSSTCGRKDTYMAYEEGTSISGGRFTNRTKANVAQREGDDPTTIAYDISGDNPFQEYWKLRMSLLTTTEAQDLMAIALCGEDRCAGNCGNEEAYGDEYMATSDATVLGEVVLSVDGGSTNTIVAGPAAWLITEDITAITCYATGIDTVRHIIGRGAGAGNGQVAYSDNGGTAWTVAAMGAVAGEFMPWNGCLFSFDAYHIWGCTDTGAGAAGNIYFSEDGGVNWVLQGTGGDALNCIHFCDYDTGMCVGDTNEILATTDGGDSWSTITGPVAQNAVDCLGVFVFSAYRWHVVYEDGELWFTEDGGTTWAQRDVPLASNAATLDRLNSIDFYDDLHGVMAAKYTDGVAGVWGAIYRTTNGGYNWECYPTDAVYDVGAIGMACVKMATPNLAYGVGDLENALGTIYKLSV